MKVERKGDTLFPQKNCLEKRTCPGKRGRLVTLHNILKETTLATHCSAQASAERFKTNPSLITVGNIEVGKL